MKESHHKQERTNPEITLENITRFVHIRKAPPFVSTDDGGLLEQIQSAIEPLTGKGKFRLQAARYNTHSGQVSVWLFSKELELKFSGNLQKNDKIRSDFRIIGEKNFFSGVYLFPALEIKIFEPGRYSAGGPDYSSLENPSNTSPDDIKYLLGISEYCAKLNNACTEIESILPELFIIFDAEHFEETKRLYNQYYNLHNPAAEYFPR